MLAYNSDIIRGLKRVLALSASRNIAAVNLSLGGGRFFDNASCDAANVAFKAAIDNLRAAGIATVISSGNNGYTDSMGSLGCISSAVSADSVGDGSALNGTTAPRDVVSGFSNSAPFLHLLTLGQYITSAYLSTVHPTNPNLVYAGTFGGSNLYQTTDGGTSWTAASGVSGSI